MFKTKVLIENELVLMQRKQSKYLYARYKHPETGTWREKSTKMWDPTKAEEAARHFYYDFTVKVENNIPTTTHSMAKLIDLYLEQLAIELKNGDRLSQSNYDLKVRITNKFIRPFFGPKFLHTVDRKMLMEFATWRRTYWANLPQDAVIEYETRSGNAKHRPVGIRERLSYAHMRDERAILNSLFRMAVTRGWIKEWHVPKVEFTSDAVPKGRNKSKVKPDAFFTPQEYHYIKKHMKAWSNRPSKFRYRRQATYYYVMLCFTTGVRPGTGLDSLRWKDIKVVQSGGNDTMAELVQGFRLEQVPKGGGALDDVRLDIWVPDSKVGGHRSIGLNEAFWFHQEFQSVWRMIAEDLYAMQQRRARTERIPINTNFNQSDPIFLMPNGYQVKASLVSSYFKAFLEEKDMVFSEGDGDARSLYSTRHSFISHMQAQGVPDGLICELAGTSMEMLEKHYRHHKVAAVGHMFKNYSTERTE